MSLQFRKKNSTLPGPFHAKIENSTRPLKVAAFKELTAAYSTVQYHQGHKSEAYKVLKS